MSVVYEVKGLNQFMRGVAKKSKRVIDNVDKELNRSSLRVEKNAKEIGPWDTGWLVMNIYSWKVGHLSYQVISPVFYSIYLEYGTRKMMAQPYMYPSVQKEYSILMDRLQKIVDRG